MDRFLITTVFIALFGAIPGNPQNAGTATPRSVSDGSRPASQMQRLFDAFIGNWRVTETFEISNPAVSTMPQGSIRQGTASFRAGPGPSIIEHYKSSGPSGNLNALALFWWDSSDHVYRLLICANNEGCELRGTAKWEGGNLVNSWEEKVDGKTANFRDSFVDISPSSFRLVSEGKGEGKTIWRVITTHERQKTKQ